MNIEPLIHFRNSVVADQFLLAWHLIKMSRGSVQSFHRVHIVGNSLWWQYYQFNENIVAIKLFFFFCIDSFLVKRSLTTGVPFFIRFRGNMMNLDFKKLLIIFLVGRHDTIRVYQRTRVALYSKICKVVCITIIK